MEIPALVDVVEVEGERLARAAEKAGLDTAVPTCPGWVVRDLVQHQGGVHRWATIYVRDAVVEQIDDDLEQLVGGWPDDAELLAWFRDGHRQLVAALRAAPPDLECFTFLAAPTPLAMWARRQAHETTIHRVDAESATGTVTPPEADVATDGIDELVSCFITRRGGRFRLDPPRTIHLATSDTDATWSLGIGPDGVTTTRDAAPPADLTLSGRASRLYLVVWNRADADSLVAEGDTELLARWRELVRVRWS